MPTGRMMRSSGSGAPRRNAPSTSLRFTAKKSKYLKHAERDQVGGDGEDDPAAGGGRAAAPPARPVHLHAERLVDQRRRDEQEDEPPVPPAVEHVAGADDEPLPQAQPRHEQPVEHVDDEEEDRERDRREEHAAACRSPGCAEPRRRPRLLRRMLHQRRRAAKPRGGLSADASGRRVERRGGRLRRRLGGVPASPFLGNHSFLIASITAWATRRPPAYVRCSPSCSRTCCISPPASGRYCAYWPLLFENSL